MPQRLRLPAILNPLGLTEGPLLKAQVRFDREIADYFKERQWHPSQRVNTLKGGYVIVSFQAGGIDEIVSWVLSWGGNAKVLGPPELIKAVIKQLAGAQKQYKIPFTSG